MRRIALALVALAPLAALTLPSVAESQTEGEGDFTLTIVKVVDGPGPTGGFQIRYDCVGDGVGSIGDVAFDAAGPGQPESQSFVVDAGDRCTVTETDANGAASTTYACVIEFTLDPASASPEGTPLCEDDQTVFFDQFGGNESVEGIVTVTNTFDEDVLPDDDEPDVDDDVVDATPPFTG